jgi:hypothetical protein
MFQAPRGYSLRLQQVISSFGIDPRTVHDLHFHFPKNGAVTATITVTVDESQLEAIEDAAMDVQEAHVEQKAPEERQTFYGATAAFMKQARGEAIENFMPHVKNGEQQ